MRIKDEEKRIKIKQAILEIVYESGLSGLNYALIAKKANVSSGTPYVYYKDKEDMLSKVYIEVKEVVDGHLEEAIQKGKNIEEKLYYAISYLAKSVLLHPVETKYVMTFRNNKELLSEEAVVLANKNLKPLFDLYEEAYQKKEIYLQDKSKLNALLIAPVYWLSEENKNLTFEEVDTLIRISIKMIMNKN